MVIAEEERLFLRQFHVVDLDTMTAVFGDPEVMRFGSGPPQQIQFGLRF